MTQTNNFPPHSLDEAKAIQTWDEVMLIAERHKINVELHSILTSEVDQDITIFDIINANLRVVEMIKRLEVIEQLINSSAKGFNEIFNKSKERPKLENEREQILGELRRIANAETTKQRQLRLNYQMERLTKQGMTERDAAKKLASEEASSGRKPITAETIRRNFNKP